MVALAEVMAGVVHTPCLAAVLHHAHASVEANPHTGTGECACTRAGRRSRRVSTATWHARRSARSSSPRATRARQLRRRRRRRRRFRPRFRAATWSSAAAHPTSAERPGAPTSMSLGFRRPTSYLGTARAAWSRHAPWTAGASFARAEWRRRHHPPPWRLRRRHRRRRSPPSRPRRRVRPGRPWTRQWRSTRAATIRSVAAPRCRCRRRRLGASSAPTRGTSDRTLRAATGTATRAWPSARARLSRGAAAASFVPRRA